MLNGLSHSGGTSLVVGFFDDELLILDLTDTAEAKELAEEDHVGLDVERRRVLVRLVCKEYPDGEEEDVTQPHPQPDRYRLAA